MKLRANQGQEIVIGGYMPSSNSFDSVLVGFDDGASLKHAARILWIRFGFQTGGGLELPECPFVNLPERAKGRSGEGPRRTGQEVVPMAQASRGRLD